MGKKRNDKRKLMRGLAVALLAVFLLTGAFLLLELWEKRQSIFPEQKTENTVYEYNGVEYVKNEDVESFLILGLDKFEDAINNDSYNNDQRADFLMLLVFDNSEKKFTAVHLNRDTMVNMNVLGVAGQKIGTVNKQLALAHTYGNGRDVSCRNTADAVSELLNGVKVNHYLSITMDAVPILNDLLGGVEVTVLDDFSGIDDTLIKGETVTLHGDHALTYVRERYGLEDSSNSTRMVRQRQYMTAVYDKAMLEIENDDNFVIEASSKLADYIVSDRSVNQLQEIAKKLSQYKFTEIETLEGESVVKDGLMEFRPDADSIDKIVFELFYKKK
ncbi:putative membrane-bound protein LytR [Ruminococcus sp. CAG:563]|nr:putative membrane-bound protein LytR [Ruminococcus sp. CAG:563]